MENIISKKYKELENKINTVMEETMILLSIDPNCTIERLLNEKVSDLNKWISDNKQVDHTQVEKEPEETISKKYPIRPEIPSFMLPTSSFLASASVTPRMFMDIQSISRSNSTERVNRIQSRSNSIDRKLRSNSVDRIQPIDTTISVAGKSMDRTKNIPVPKV